MNNKNIILIIGLIVVIISLMLSIYDNNSIDSVIPMMSNTAQPLPTPNYTMWESFKDNLIDENSTINNIGLE